MQLIIRSLFSNLLPPVIVVVGFQCQFELINRETNMKEAVAVAEAEYPQLNLNANKKIKIQLSEA